MATCTRRKFLETSLAAAAGLALGPDLLHGALLSDGNGVLPVPAGGYPLLEVSGTHREIGFQLGSAM